ncbi:unnamed protein product [Orchesella dallaii]|uniref:Uncharacterized protein n=1 Tax=Orchesella dallaii TaxID=48710 RepID=A0ABP1S031_9HEXA
MDALTLSKAVEVSRQSETVKRGHHVLKGDSPRSVDPVENPQENNSRPQNQGGRARPGKRQNQTQVEGEDSHKKARGALTVVWRDISLGMPMNVQLAQLLVIGARSKGTTQACAGKNFKLDPGADVSIIPCDVWKQKFPRKKLEQPMSRLSGPDGSRLETVEV